MILLLTLFCNAKCSHLKFTQAFCELKETQAVPQTSHLPKLPVSREHLFAQRVTLWGMEDANYAGLEGVPQVCVC